MPDLCPYCNKRVKIRKTCFALVCQMKHQKKLVRDNFNTYIRKTPQLKSRLSLRAANNKSEMNSAQE